MNLLFALLIAYSVALVGLGLWIGRHVRSGGDFFVAGRGLSAGLIFSTFLAANIGAGSTVGATGLGWEDGLSAWWRNGSAGIGSLALAFLVAPRMWREAKTHGDLTVGDFLQRHYGSAMRGLVAVLIWIGTLSILAAQLLGIAAVLQVVAGVPPLAGCLIGSLATTGYFVAGGLLSSAWVNRVQLVVILLGFAVAAVVAVGAAGGWPALAAGESGRLAFLGNGTTAPGWRYVFLLAPAFIVSPGLLQKAFGARDVAAATRGIAWNGGALVLFAWAPAVIGLAAYQLYPSLPHRDLALPTLLAGSLPPIVGGLALAAVFSAEVSSADAVLFMLATSGARDLYQGYVRPDASDAEVLRVARWMAVVGAVFGVGLSLMYGSVITALDVFYAILTVTLFVPVVGALYGGGHPAAGIVSVGAGIVTLAAVQFTTAGAGFGVLTPTLAGILASTAGFLIMRSTLRVARASNRT